ncbi:AAA family ATPase [Marinoscillum luteum]|uniref:AAA family ATPase n=1 Tax=Marinoscillum luteum TaxID=861051 RepID=A0ABW7NBA7_9BACT
MKKVFPLLEEITYSRNIDGTLEMRGDVISLAFSRNYYFMDVLSKFLEHFKPKIDQAVKRKLDENESYSQSMKEYNERNDIQGTQEIEERGEGYKPIEFIWPGDFKNNLKRINAYRDRIRKGFVINEGPRVSRVRIRGVGDIREEISIKIPKRSNWVFLTGENGCGKTTILKAITAAFYKEELFVPNIIKSGKVDIELSKKSDELRSIPFAAYGPTRLVSTISEHIDAVEEKSTPWYSIYNSDGFLKGLNELHYIYSDNLDMLHNTVDYLQDLFSYSEKSTNETIEEGSKGELIPQLEYVDFSDFITDKKVRFFEKDNSNVGYGQPRSFEELASGVKSLVALISDLIIRILDNNRQETDFTNFRGLVLIDEIDIHFHPSMQKQIVEILSQWFPKVQFIVTTHSPITLLGAPKHSVFYRVTRSANYGVSVQNLDMDITDLLPNTLLSSPIFGFNDIINDQHDRNQKLHTENDYDEVVFNKILEKKIAEKRLELGLDDDSDN